MIEKFYAVVDKENKIILNTIQELPKNWHNICGLNLLSDPELKELGWINVTDPDLLEYEYSREWLDQCRLTFNWKTLDWVDTLSSSELISLTDAIHTYIQECFDVEHTFSEQLKSINTLEELLSVDYTLAWPTTSLT